MLWACLDSGCDGGCILGDWCVCVWGGGDGCGGGGGGGGRGGCGCGCMCGCVHRYICTQVSSAQVFVYMGVCVHGGMCTWVFVGNKYMTT